MVSCDRYILNDKDPTPEPDLFTWAKWLENTANRIVAKTVMGEMKVSTIFLGLDHNFGGAGEPVLFETMIFGLPEDEEYQERYTSWNEAEKGHQRAIDWLNFRMDEINQQTEENQDEKETLRNPFTGSFYSLRSR